MNKPSLERCADHFERLRTLPPDERERALARLSLDEQDRELLRRLLDADSEADDPLADVLSAGAAQFARPRTDRLGSYRLIRELGAGGMGTVFLAERVDGGFAQAVAIKLLRGFPTADSLRRLRQERQILANLDHPHIARLLDGGETEDGQPWLAIEHVDGLPLLEHVSLHAPRLRDRLALFDAMLDAIGHAHRSLVIHRDIKPANVMVNHAGEVKLLDFGIARLVDLDTGAAARETSTRVFSAGYASPEQRAGQAVTTVSDIYSLGVLLRELIARPTLSSPAIVPDAELAGIIAKATDDDPARRYAGAGEFRDDLDRYHDGRPVRAARLTRRYRLRKFIGRHRLGVAVALAVVAALSLFVWRLDSERERALAAEAAAEQARAASERDAASARAALTFLTDAFNAAAPENALSKTVSVRDLLDKATARLDQGEHDPVVTASMQRLLGRLYDSLGDQEIARQRLGLGLDGVDPTDRTQALEVAMDLDQYANLLGIADHLDQARAAIDRAEQLRQRFAPDDTIAQAWTLLSRAIWHSNAGENAKAIPLFRQVLALSSPTLELPSGMEVRAAAFLATRLSNGGDCNEAIAVAERGLRRLADQHESVPQRLWLLRNRAAALRACGRPAEAETVLRELMTLQAGIVDGNNMQMMQLSNELSLTLRDQGRFREAAALLQDMQVPDDFGPFNRAAILANLALTLEDFGDYPQALRLSGQARALLDDAGFDADHDGQRAMSRIHARQLALSGQSGQAVAVLEDLRSRARRIDGESTPEYINTTWQLAFAKRVAGQAEAALPLAEEAQKLWSGTLPAQHRNFAMLHRFRARVALDLDRPEVAESELDAALAILRELPVQPFEIAVAHGEQAALRLHQGRQEEARSLIQSALPLLRDAYAPGQIDRRDAERIAAQLGVH